MLATTWIAKAAATGALACSSFSSSLAAQAHVEPGSVAPRGAWYTRSGCAARTGVSASRPLCDTPRTLWSRDFDGTIVGEPLAWDSHVVVEVLRPGRGRTLEVLDLESGVQISSSPTYAADTELEPSLWANCVAVRSGTRAIDLLYVAEPMMTLGARVEREHAVAAPLIFDGELYVRGETGVERLSLAPLSTTWRSAGTFRGELAVRGDRVYGVQYAEDGRAFVVQIQRDDGVESARGLVGFHDGDVPKFDDPLAIDVLAPQVFVHFPLPIPVAGSQPMRVGQIDLSAPSEDRIAVHALIARTTDHEAGWLGLRVEDGQRECFLDAREVDGTYVRLGDREVHPELVERGLPISIAGGTAYAGPTAFDVQSRRVWWIHPNAVGRRTVPTDRGALLVEGESRLVHVGSTPRASVGEWLAPADDGSAQTSYPKASAYLRSGAIERADVALDRAARTLRVGKKKERSLADLRALEDGARALVYAADERSLVRAIDDAARLEVARKRLELAREALSARDGELAARLLATAREGGVDAADAEKVERSLASFAKTRDPQRAAQGKVETILSKERELVASRARMLLERLEALPPSAPITYRLALARAAIAGDPDSSSARQALRACVPSALAAFAEHDAEGALELARALELYQAELCEVPAPAGAPATRVEAACARARADWRPELVAVRTPRLLVLCTPQTPRAVARAIAYGELASKALEPIFGDALRTGPPLERLVVQLYESAARYEAVAGPTTTEEPRNHARRIAHFDPTTSVTHVHWPDGVDDHRVAAEARARFAHSIAHHWMRERCPRAAQALTRKQDRAQNGFWVVEGLAGFVEELDFDVERATFEPAAGRSQSLDVNARMPKDYLHDWDGLFFYSKDQVDLMRAIDGTVAPLAGWVGREHAVTHLDLFRAQATATVQYLHDVDGGRLRGALADYAHAYYVGTVDRRYEFKRSFGHDPNALGELVYAWASRASGAAR